MEIFDKVEYMEEKKSIKLLLNCLFFFFNSSFETSKLFNDLSIGGGTALRQCAPNKVEAVYSDVLLERLKLCLFFRCYRQIIANHSYTVHLICSKWATWWCAIFTMNLVYFFFWKNIKYKIIKPDWYEEFLQMWIQYFDLKQNFGKVLIHYCFGVKAN